MQASHTRRRPRQITVIPLICEFCGGSFIGNSLRRRFCSKRCSRAGILGWDHHEGCDLVCVECGKSFTAKRSGRKYCSVSCSREAHKRKWWEATKPPKKRCRYCKTEFQPYKGSLYCSKTCKERAAYESRFSESECINCGKIARTKKGSRFCSTSCASLHNSNKDIQALDFFRVANAASKIGQG